MSNRCRPPLRLFAIAGLGWVRSGQGMTRSAFRLCAREGMARPENQAEWPEREYPSAAWGQPKLLKVRMVGVRLRFRRICRWRNGKIVSDCRQEGNTRDGAEGGILFQRFR